MKAEKKGRDSSSEGISVLLLLWGQRKTLPNVLISRSVFPILSCMQWRISARATDNPARRVEDVIDIPPFETIEYKKNLQLCDEALKTKLAITLACSSFRKLCMEIMYEDIRIRHGNKVLADTLEASVASGGELGSCVKRAVLFPINKEVEQNWDESCKNVKRILECCPKILMLVRPPCDPSEGDQNYLAPFPSESSSVPSLQRIDWHSGSKEGSSDLSQIPPLFWTSPSLRTLSLGVSSWGTFTGNENFRMGSISSQVRTLRVCSLDTLGSPGQQMYSLNLSLLNRIILDQPDSMYALFGIAQYGEQVRSIELVKRKNYSIRSSRLNRRIQIVLNPIIFVRFDM
ncbi:hypothetical protein PNOK_0016300 [Pyrrhoderma noxium]|uniref:Uncharacterized protein n=1 Tax=Pyrrhoderma noxium TaxID=2282107 RepID=A0A286UU18_9AGAM|nr:hypothetical protein PNOK_0016300 [Pyrrhoderma noxium]